MTLPSPGDRVYIDHAATAPLRPEARDAFLAASSLPGNPTSRHGSGRHARGVLDDALESLADSLDVPVSWLTLTSGGTEADNIAVRGAALAAHAADPSRRAVAVCATDHPAVLETARSLTPTIEDREIAVSAEGLLDLDALRGALAPGDVSVVSVALVNNETGVIQDLEAITEIAHAAGALVHTDAVQATSHVPLPVHTVDMLSLTGHKIGAPVGVGLLVARPDIPFVAGLTGGGQQRGVRPGTLDAPHTASLAAALERTLADREAESARLGALAERLREGIRAIDPEAVVTAAAAPRSPHVVHVMLPGCDQDALLLMLDQQGIDASAGSACSAGVTQASHVLIAMGVDPDLARGALRLSLGWSTQDGDVDRVLAALPEAIQRARALGALTR
ncbi:cysteine desulfurase [Brachybacterium endophyticum]|uniref:cysteine desulfurase n=1 Tax=Brachybacterium endophyticum TaxID=2182385 RepID=A0A2U2RHT3_9MICO|nr:cysteine desulfurase family protein [Brachybacterium endophyticum]PWH05410.1 cysteine desulfurase [Brachybacterium endophyticum]